MKRNGQRLDQGKIARLLVSKWCGVAYGLLGFIVGGIGTGLTMLVGFYVGRAFAMAFAMWMSREHEKIESKFAGLES